MLIKTVGESACSYSEDVVVDVVDAENRLCKTIIVECLLWG